MSMKHTPDASSGTWLDLYSEHVQPNLIPVDVVASVHEWMKRYCREMDAPFPVRYVGSTERPRQYYLLKDSAETDVIQPIRAVCAGKAFFSPAVSKVLADDYLRQIRQQGVDDPYDLLTSRERELLQLIAELKSTKDIAGLLGVSPHTIDAHRSNPMQKSNVHSTPELILYAVRKGRDHRMTLA